MQEETKKQDDELFDSVADALDYIYHNVGTVVPEGCLRTVGGALDYLRATNAITPREKMDLTERCDAVLGHYKAMSITMVDVASAATMVSSHEWKLPYQEGTLDTWAEMIAEVKIAAQMTEEVEKRIIMLRQSVAIIRVIIVGIKGRVVE